MQSHSGALGAGTTTGILGGHDLVHTYTYFAFAGNSPLELCLGSPMRVKGPLLQSPTEVAKAWGHVT